MQRFTISLDETLAAQFDRLIAQRGYENRSEAVRDLIRLHLNDAPAAANASWCVANVSYVYDHHDQPATGRLLNMQHDHHDLVTSSVHTHLDHSSCLETVVLRGPVAAVREFAQKLIALRGVRHGNVHLIPLDAEGGEHTHPPGHAEPHVHYKPRS